MQRTVPPAPASTASTAQPHQLPGRPGVPGLVATPGPAPGSLAVGAPATSTVPASNALLPPTLPISNAPPNPAPGTAQQPLALQHQHQLQAQHHMLQQQQIHQQVEMQRRHKEQQQLLQQQQLQQAKYAQPQQPQQHLQQQPPQQQQHIPHQGLNGGWQSDKDVDDRRKMIAKIVQLLQQRKPNAPQEWLKKLPQMAKRLEESLYRSAPSFEAYNDDATLKHRLQQLAMNIGTRSKARNQAAAQAQLAQQKQPQQQHQQFQAQQQTQPTTNSTNGITVQPLQQQPQISLQQPQIQLHRPPQRQMVNMSDINPIIGGTPHQANSGQATSNAAISETGLPQVAAGFEQSQTSVPVGPLANPADQKNQVNGIQHVQQQVVNQQVNVSGSLNQSSALVGAVNNAAPSPATNGSLANTNSNSRPGSDRQQVLRHQQQRLLLLRHAAKCPHEDGRCPVTPHCAGMKRLWKHIAECKDQKCLVPHCVSSRYVLSHYHRCKDVRCPVCGPVREAIHRSHEKQKQMQMQALKHGHEQAMHQNGMPSAPAAAPTLIIPPQLQQKGAGAGASASASAGVSNSAVLPRTPASGGASTVMPTSAQTVTSSDETMPPGKRRKTESNDNQNTHNAGAEALAAVSQPQSLQQAQQQPQQQPQQSPPVPQPTGPFSQSSAAAAQNRPPVPGPKPSNQPSNSTMKDGYVYSQPQNSSVSSSSAPLSAGNSTPLSAVGAIQAAKQPGPKPKEDHTLINSFTIEQIETHIRSLNKGLQLSPQRLKLKCLEVIKVLQSHQHGWVFNNPVDPVELALPDYFQVIKRPMDLGTIRRRLDNGCYHALEDFEADVVLTFDNAMLYNPEGSVVYNMAEEMKAQFVLDYESLVQQLNKEEDEKRKNGDACALCGREKLLFEPPVFYCNGPNCPSKRIRRNSYYFVGGNNQYHWCHLCYGELKESQAIEMADMTLKKDQLVKKKNDEIHEESWVQCDRCERWIHQICGLFNTRQNKDQRSEYTCPRCTIEERKKKGATEGTSSTPMAEDLPRTKLSEHLETQVRQKVDEYMLLRAKEKADAENISVDEAKKSLLVGGPVTIRQVTSMDRKLEVRERMKRRYAFKKYPSEFTFRCKCVIVFQNLDGVDVILFGLYVYEHDEKNPPPNRRAVYVSYLDSVHYMKPRKMRTFIYHEILIAYLDYVRQKGFATAHIWACPPLKGDDYILYAKPEDQKTPKDDRLRQWYLDMLEECQRRGIVGKMTNMYDLYFSNPKNDATVVPYMDGDYFPAEVENIIKDLEEGRNSKKASAGGKKKKSSKSRAKSKSGRGTRSSGIDEEALTASGIVPPGVEQKSLEEGGRDFVMAKLGETIHPMKESFIVAYLSWSGAREEDMVVPNEIAEYRKKHGIRPSFDLVKDDTTADIQGSRSGAAQVEPSTAKEPPDGGSRERSVNNGRGSSEVPNVASSSIQNSDFDSKDANSSKASKPAQTSSDSVRDGKFAAMAARKRDLEGNSKPEPVASTASIKTIVRDSQGRLVKVLDDDLEEMDCEFLNNRQAFLNLCQGNHYQFDQLRRAKHTSMMVLWHLHNRDAPKFVQQCAVCSREILTGYRYHCPTCADYDQCQECASNSNTPPHPHQLKRIPVASGKQSELTDAQRKERQRSIQLHMTLLLHAATCVSPTCPSANCTKMKGLLKHGAQCQIKSAGGCHVCKRIWTLLQIHARQCKQNQCPVPNCMAIRERFRQLTKQQRAMDDRRRQEMNRAYRGNR